MKLIFQDDGKLIASGADAYASYQSDDDKFFGDSTSGVTEMWRYSYDVENGAVVVAYPTMTDAEALAQLEIDAAAEANAE